MSLSPFLFHYFSLSLYLSIHIYIYISLSLSLSSLSFSLNLFLLALSMLFFSLSSLDAFPASPRFCSLLLSPVSVSVSVLPPLPLPPSLPPL